MFEGLVQIGHTITLQYLDMRPLPTDSNIETYPPSGDRNPSTVIQSLFFHTSCLQPLSCLDVLGTYQIVAFQNEFQQQVPCLTTIPFKYMLSNLGSAIKIQKVMFGFMERTRSADRFINMVLDKDNPAIQVTFEEQIDPRLALTYHISFIFLSQTRSTSWPCNVEWKDALVVNGTQR